MGTGAATPDYNRVATDVTEDSNWAYCSDFCTFDDDYSNRLQVSYHLETRNEQTIKPLKSIAILI